MNAKNDFSNLYLQYIRFQTRLKERDLRKAHVLPHQPSAKATDHAANINNLSDPWACNATYLSHNMVIGNIE